MAATTQTITYKFQGNAAGFMKTVTQVSNGLKRVTKTNQDGLHSISETTVQTSKLGGALKSMSIGAKAGVNAFMNMSNSLRLTAQGMMSVGKGLTMFITPLIFLSLKSAAKVAIDFDAALVRVSKTTQLTGKSLNDLAMGLRAVGVTTATSQVDLAKMAEQIGQLGVRDVPSILSLVDTFNMLTMATEISADKVAIAMGKIANAFGIDLNTEEGAKEILQLSTVINRLENELAASAPEILKGLENFAQVGSLIDFPPETGAAFIASLVSVGYSAEEAGTGLRNMTIKVVQHSDKIAQLMANTEGYTDAASVMNAINEDAAKVLIDLTAAAAGGDEAAQTLFATIEAGGIRGGKAWASLAGSHDILTKSLAVMTDEMENGLSLWNEYQAALLSTENQLKVLRNNFNEVSLTLGDTLLPVLNEIIQTIIPAIRWLAAEFKKLSPEIKKNIMVVALLIGIAGPVILFLSQIVFGFSMIMIAIAKVGSLILSLGGIFGFLQGALSKLGISLSFAAIGMNGLVVAIVAGAAIILMKVTGLGTKIAEVFIGLGESAAAWGQNLIATYGAGMLSGAVNVLARVLTAIGNFIGRFLAGSSPPDVGPLSHIDLWGKNVFDAFLGGFMNADFSILSQVGGLIEKIFSTLAKTGLMGDKDQFKFAMKARQDLAELINIFNETGEVSQSVLNSITEHLGEASDEIQEMIRLWLDYTRIQKELAAIEAKREGILDTYRQEIQLIAQSNMTAEEKAAAIRDAMSERDDGLRILSQEERELEKQKTLAEQQLELQKSMIAAMQHQDDLQLKLIDTLKEMSSALGDLADFAFPELEAGGIGDDVSVIYDAIVTLEERIAKAAGVWDSFLAGFKGEDPIDIDEWLAEIMGEDFDLIGTIGADNFVLTLQDIAPELVPIVERMQTAYETGTKLGDTWETISGIIERVSGFLDNLFGEKAPAGEGKGILEALGFGQDTIDSLTESWETGIQTIKDLLGPVWEDIGTKWQETWDVLKDDPGIQKILEGFQDLIDWFSTVDWEGVWAWVASVVGGSILAFIGFVSGFVTVIAWIITTLINAFITFPEKFEAAKEEVIAKAIELRDRLVLWALNLVTKVGVALLKFREKATLAMTALKTAFLIGALLVGLKIVAKVKDWVQKVKDGVANFKTAGEDIIQGVIDGIDAKLSGVVSAVTAIYDAALAIWQKIWGLESPSKVMKASGEYIMQGAIEGIEGMSDQFKSSLVGSTEGLIGEGITGGVPSSVNALGGAGGTQITLQFGKDSVRTDEDIEDIADAVERVLSNRAEGNMSVGTI